MKLTAALAALILAFSSTSKATDPVSIETKWNVKTFSISTTGVTSATFDIGGFNAQGYAILGGTYTANGVDGTTLGTILAITTNTVNVVGFSWSALPIGGLANLQISQTIKVPPPHPGYIYGVASSTNIPKFNSPAPMANAFVTPLISTSSTIVIPNSVPLSASFEAETTNPRFIFTGLTAAATLYFTTNYGIPRVQ